jgi:dihydrofolate reductase
MRNVVVPEYVSLDGVMQDPGGAGEFEHGGWSMPYWNDEIAQFKFEELFASDALLLGRVTYQGFAAAWPTMTGTGAYDERMNSLPKYVVSTTLQEVTWNNARLLKGDSAEEVSRLKQQPGQEFWFSVVADWSTR